MVPDRILLLWDCQNNCFWKDYLSAMDGSGCGWVGWAGWQRGVLVEWRVPYTLHIVCGSGQGGVRLVRERVSGAIL
jgi:hypothetical protein